MSSNSTCSSSAGAERGSSQSLSKGRSQAVGTRLFSVVPSDRTGLGSGQAPRPLSRHTWAALVSGHFQPSWLYLPAPISYTYRAVWSSSTEPPIHSSIVPQLHKSSQLPHHTWLPTSQQDLSISLTLSSPKQDPFTDGQGTATMTVPQPTCCPPMRSYAQVGMELQWLTGSAL